MNAIVNPKLNVYQRVHAVAVLVEYVKRQSVPMSGTGVYRDVVVSEIRQHLLANGVLVTTTQIPGSGRFIEPSAKALEKNHNLVIYLGTYTTRFTNIDDPKNDYFELHHEAQGNDFGDKAPGKASTYAEKLNLVQGLLLETGIADESRNPGEGGDSGDATATNTTTSQIKPPASKSSSTTAESSPEDTKLASNGLVKQIQSAAKAKGLLDRVERNLEKKEQAWETMTTSAAKTLWKWLQEQPDATDEDGGRE